MVAPIINAPAGDGELASPAAARRTVSHAHDVDTRRSSSERLNNGAGVWGERDMSPLVFRLGGRQPLPSQSGSKSNPVVFHHLLVVEPWAPHEHYSAPSA